MTQTQKEPLLRVGKRIGIPSWKAWLIRAAAVIAALMVNGLFIFLTSGINPFQAYAMMFEGTFGNNIYLWSTIESTVKLLCIAIALAPAFKMKFWNCGGEGQVLIGALATAFIMTKFNTLPPALLLIFMIAGSAFMGALWGVIPAIFKAKWGTNETLFTLMMNYIAIQLVAFATNIWRGEKASLGILNRTTKAGWLPKIMDQGAFIPLMITLLFAVLMFVYLKKMKHGYEISVVGESVNTARYAGINVGKVIIRTMALSGMICGLCGFMTVSGVDHSVSTSTAGGYGFTAIIVAWLAKFNTFYMIGVSLFVILLEKGTSFLSNQIASFSASASAIVTGVILFFVIGSEFFINYRLILRKSAKKEVKRV